MINQIFEFENINLKIDTLKESFIGVYKIMLLVTNWYIKFTKRLLTYLYVT